MEKKSGSRRKAWLFQGIVLGILVLGICFLFAVSGDERYSHVMNGEGYESTESFGALFYSDMEKAIRYTRLAELLETDGELNLQAEIAELPVAEDVVTSITLQDAIYYGESLGLYFDEDNNLIISDGGFDWKAGASNKAAAARELPVEAEQNTLEEYAEYYSGYKGDLVQEEMEETQT